MNNTKQTDIIIYQKTSKTFLLRIKKYGNTQNITGWTIYFTVKENLSDPESQSLIQKDIITHIDASSGKSLIELTPEDTDLEVGSYYYDILIKDTAENITLLIEGRVKISKHATTRQ